MRRFWWRKAPKILVVVAVIALVASFVVMSLWNWLMPPLFGRPVITFWEALGVLVFTRILFGGFRGRAGPSPWHWRRRMMARWEQMTPEEREKFRNGLAGNCPPFGPPAEQKA